MSDTKPTPPITPAPETNGKRAVSTTAPKCAAAKPAVDPLDELMKPRRGRKPKEPCWRDQLNTATMTGDVCAVIELCDPIEKRPMLMPCLRQAMEIVAKKNPAQLVEFLYKRILVFQGMQLIRSQIVADDGIRGYETSTKNVGVPDDVATVLLPRVSMLQSEIQGTAQALARTLHTMNLADGGTKLDQKNLAKVISIFEKHAGNSDKSASAPPSEALG